VFNNASSKASAVDRPRLLKRSLTVARLLAAISYLQELSCCGLEAFASWFDWPETIPQVKQRGLSSAHTVSGLGSPEIELCCW